MHLFSTEPVHHALHFTNIQLFLHHIWLPAIVSLMISFVINKLRQASNKTKPKLWARYSDLSLPPTVAMLEFLRMGTGINT